MFRVVLKNSLIILFLLFVCVFCQAQDEKRDKRIMFVSSRKYYTICSENEYDSIMKAYYAYSSNRKMRRNKHSSIVMLVESSDTKRFYYLEGKQIDKIIFVDYVRSEITIDGKYNLVFVDKKEYPVMY